MRTALMRNSARYPIVFERGEGCRLYDTDGNVYLDMLGGIATSSLGHAHPALRAAIGGQTDLLHVSNLYYTQPAIDAAQALVDKLGPGLVYFCNSGSEAVETAIKIVRKHAWRNGDTERNEIVCVEGSFHGRTLGSLAATMQPAKWEGFGPMPQGFVSVPLDDVDALRAALTERTAAVMIEPIQGEAGVRPLTTEFARTARQAADEVGALLVCDEIQTGIGRTGAWWGYEHLGIEPDVVTLGKGLGGGFPVAATWATASTEQGAGTMAADALQPSDHNSTIGGGPLACAAVTAVLQTIERDGLVEHAGRMGERAAELLEPLGPQVRGRGLLWAVDLGADRAGEVVEATHARGAIVNAVTPSAIRIAPPLIVTAAELEEGIAALAGAIGEVLG